MKPASIFAWPRRHALVEPTHSAAGRFSLRKNTTSGSSFSSTGKAEKETALTTTAVPPDHTVPTKP